MNDNLWGLKSGKEMFDLVFIDIELFRRVWRQTIGVTTSINVTFRTSGVTTSVFRQYPVWKVQ